MIIFVRMAVIYLIFYLTAGIYLCFILWCIYLWIRKEECCENSNHQTPRLSVVIPFRNEENNLKGLIDSLSKQTYPSDMYELIFVDDQSEDNGAAIVAEAGYKLLQNTGNSQGKKAALERGIAEAQNEYIVTIDADCIVPEEWLRAIARIYIEQETDFITGPVHILGKNGFAQIQALENSGMMLITHAGYESGLFHLANGANLSFKKSLYISLGAYAGNRDRASGDDVFMAQKFAEAYSLSFLKCQNSIVHTAAVESIKEFWQQRLRWASKGDLYTQPFMKIIPAFTALFYLMCFSSIILAYLGHVELFVVMVGVKFISDLFIFLTVRQFFSFKWSDSFWLPIASMFHLLYVPIVGFSSLFIKKYEWKGRKMQ